MKTLKKIYDDIGLPRLIIGLFFIFLVVTSIGLGFSPAAIFSDVIRRWLMYGTLVLAMVPGIQSGIGLNFGVSLGISTGLLGSVLAMEISFLRNWNEVLGAGAPWLTLILALVFGVVMAAVLGTLYGMLLNRVKGSEMTVSTYVGFSMIAFMNMIWLALPFKSGELIWPIGQQGMRNTISLASSFGEVLNKLWGFQIGELHIPTGLILFFLISCLFVFQYS